MNVRVLVLAFLLLAALPAIGQSADGMDVQTITQDTTWTLEDRTIPGQLVVAEGATLTLEGTTLRISDQLRVEKGARLVLHPSAGRPTVIQYAGQGPITHTNGYWILINGSMESSGTPPADISGLRGDGLNALHIPVDGLQVAGTATLEDLVIHDSNASLHIPDGGSAVVRRATFRDVGFTAIGVKGRLDIADSTLESVNGIFAHKTCDITATRLTIRTLADNIMVNGCPMSLSDSTLHGAGNSLSISGEATFAMSNTTALGYTRHGVWAREYPGDNGTLRPTLTFEDCVFDAFGNGARGAPSTGVSLRGINSASLENVTIRGNTGNGIQHQQGGPLDVRNSTITGNGFFGLFAMMSSLGGEPMHGNGNDFGNATTANAKGAVYQRVDIKAGVVDEDGKAYPGTAVTIFNAGGTVLAIPPANTTIAMLQIDTYKLVSPQLSEFQGPFTYELAHPMLGKPVGGDLDISPMAVYLVGEVSGKDEGFTVLGLHAGAAASIALGVSGVGLLVAGAFGTRVVLWLRRR